MATKASAARMVDFSESTWSVITANTYTVQLSDAAGVLAFNASSTTPVMSVLIPNNNYPTGFSFSATRLGTRRVGFFAGPGVVFRTAGTTSELSLTNSIGSAIYSGSPATGWLLFGDFL